MLPFSQARRPTYHQRKEDSLGEPLSLKRLRHDAAAATAIEYAFVALLIAMAIVSVVGSVGTNVSSIFTTVAGKL
jgi:pilus assembly protein Flp/PilA